MKLTFLSIALLTIALSLRTANAQVAAKKGVTIEEIHQQIGFLYQKNDEESKNLLALEAKALVKSNNEQWMTLGASVYVNLQNKAAAENVNKLIAKKFPRGLNARFEGYNKVFATNSTRSALETEKLYNSWLLKFPVKSFEEKERNIYVQADANMAILFFGENNMDKGRFYVEKFKSDPNFPVYINGVGTELIKNNNFSTAATLLEPAYTIALEATNAGSKNKNKIAITRAYYNLAPTYAKALVNAGRTDDAILVLEELIKHPSGKREASIEQLAQAYSINGRDLDAFLLLDDFLFHNENDEKLIKAITSLYIKLNQNKEGNINDYLASLAAKSVEVVLAKYRHEMIKKEAPDFSLLNMKGETVSLAGLRGKVVVLDFWATWCAPCKQSFPGMQAVINKYKDDENVAFLFIDIWQQEDNFKELAQNFIIENHYTFNVLFDEMKDRSKSTATAYGIRGIPHKIVIDKQGFIRFDSSGGSSDTQKIVNEIAAKIELAKEG